ncbi:MAG: hypothetical protein GDA37_01955 [Ekhidna sp.]|nr:hypothetical protein [Ekhidna sp.]
MILSAVMALPLGIYANASDVSTNAEAFSSKLARCTIKDRGFYGTGRCGAVLKAYRKWLEMQDNKHSVLADQRESIEESILLEDLPADQPRDGQ